MIFKRFDYQHPPANGVFWIEFSIPETDVDTDDSGETVGWYTGETTRKLGMVFIDNIDDNGLPFMAIPVDSDLCSFDGELALIHTYALAAVPDLPEDRSTGTGWIEHSGELSETVTGSARWFWVAIRNETCGDRYVTLAQHEIVDDQLVPGFESPGHTYYPVHELYPGDKVTHYAPLEIPTLPVIVEPEMLATKDELIQDVMRLGGSVVELYAVSTGQIPHIYQGMCPDTVEGAGSRDDECPACKILLKADEALAASGLANPGVQATPVATDQQLRH